jgi:hypothetical protein
MAFLKLGLSNLRLPIAMAAVLLVASACGGSSSPPYVVNPGSDLSLTPSSIQVLRYPAVCGVSNPPFTDQDLFSIDVRGPQTPPPPWSGLSVNFYRKVAVGRPLDLSLTPFANPQSTASGDPTGATQSGTAPADANLDQFDFFWGSKANTVDSNPLDSATVTVLAFPEKNEDPLTVRVQLRFTDGKTLDESFSGPLFDPNSANSCPAG